MTPLLGLLLAVLVTWAARILMIVLVPADRLSPQLMRILDDAIPAVFGALTMATLLAVRATSSTLVGPLIALGVAGILAYRRASLGFVVLGAVGVAAALRLLGLG